jgi:hypothetical protein
VRIQIYFSANIKTSIVKANSSVIIKLGSNHGPLPTENVENLFPALDLNGESAPHREGGSGALPVVVIPKKLANLLKFRLRLRQ